MSPSISAVSADSTGINSTASNNTNKENKVGKLEKRAIDGHAKKLALIEKYKELLRVIKITERYYQSGETDKMPLRRNKVKKYLGSAKIYNKLPTINNNMNNEEIQQIIKNQRKKMIQGVLRGAFPEFNKKTIQLKRLKKEQNGKLSDKNKEPLKAMRNNLLKKHKNLQTIINAESVINDYIKKTIMPLKRTFEEFEKTTQVYILKKQKMDEERYEKKKKKVELQKYKKLVQLFKAKQKKIVEAKVKARKRSKENKAKKAEKNARKQAKKTEKTAREEAKQADQEKKQVIRKEKAAEKALQEAQKEARRVEREEKAAERATEKAEKEARKLARQQKAAEKKAEKELRNAKREAKQAIKQAAILEAAQKMSSKNLAKF